MYNPTCARLKSIVWLYLGPDACVAPYICKPTLQASDWCVLSVFYTLIVPLHLIRVLFLIGCIVYTYSINPQSILFVTIVLYKPGLLPKYLLKIYKYFLTFIDLIDL